MPARLNFDRDRRLIDNRLKVQIVNPDGTTATTPIAYKRGTTGSTFDGHPTQKARWHVWKKDLGAFIPRESGELIDPAGNVWFISEMPDCVTFTERYVLTCVLQPGIGVV